MSPIEDFFLTLEKLSPAIRALIFLGTILFGWFFSSGIGQVVKRFLDKLKVGSILKRIGWEEAFSKLGISLNISKLYAKIVKWTFFILFLMLAFEIVNLPEFSNFLGKILGYFPNIYISMLIFLIAVYLVDFSYKVFLVSAEKKGLKYSRLIGKGSRILIWIFAVLAIFLQLGIATEIIKAMLWGIVGILVLALGISFGLGGKDLVKEFLEDVRQKFS